VKKHIALIVAALIVLFSDVLFFGSGFYVRDMLRDYQPWRFAFREVVLRYHELPLWNPWQSAGQPFAANPGFQLFYPPTWLVLLPPSFRFGFNLEVVAHIALAAAGMYALLRELKLRAESAAFGAVAFGLGGGTLSLTNLLPYLTSVAWWPLVVLLELRLLRDGTRRDLARFALVVAMVLLAAEQLMIVQTAILVASIAILERRRLALLGGAGMLALLIAAVQLVPALALKRETPRAHDLPVSEALQWSMPLDRPIELFLPHAHGRIVDEPGDYRGFFRYRPPQLPLIFSIYCGVAVPLLFIAGLFIRSAWRWWAAALALLSYLMAAGENTPLMRWLYDAGLFRAVRYPEKLVLLGLFAMIVFAAITLDRLDRRIVVTVLLLTIADVGRYVNDNAPRKPQPFFDAPPVVAAIPNALGPSRIFPAIEWDPHLPDLQRRFTLYRVAREGMLPYANALWGVRAACEIDTTHTTQQATADFVESMWQGMSHGAPPAAFLAMANVEYVVSASSEHVVDAVHLTPRPRYEFADQIVPMRTRDDFVRAMAARPWSPRAAFVTSPPFAPARGDVLRVHEGIDAIDLDVRVAGRALLLIRNTPHPNWRATIDGRPAPLQVANVGFTAMEVPAGAHHVMLRYRDSLMAICGAVSILALIAAIILGLQRPR